MIVHARMPAPTLADHRAALRDCLPTLALSAPTVAVLFLALFVVDPTPHLGPQFPGSIGLTVGALIAMAAQGAALTARYRERLDAQRRQAAHAGRHRAE